MEAYLTATHLDALAETAGGLAPHEEAALAALQAAAAAAAPPVLSATALVQQLEDPANTLLSTVRGCSRGWTADAGSQLGQAPTLSLLPPVLPLSLPHA